MARTGWPSGTPSDWLPCRNNESLIEQTVVSKTVNSYQVLSLHTSILHGQSGHIGLISTSQASPASGLAMLRVRI